MSQPSAGAIQAVVSLHELHSKGCWAELSAVARSYSTAVKPGGLCPRLPASFAKVGIAAAAWSALPCIRQRSLAGAVCTLQTPAGGLSCQNLAQRVRIDVACCERLGCLLHLEWDISCLA